MGKPESARRLHFENLDAVLADARLIADQPDCISRGTWTPAQNIWHVGRVIRALVEGFPASVPFFFKLVGPLIKGRYLTRSFNPGITIPAGLAKHFIAPPEMTMADAMAMIESAVAKQQDQGFISASPLFGRLSAKQWVDLHCRHAEMHFGLIEFTNQAAAPAGMHT